MSAQDVATLRKPPTKSQQFTEHLHQHWFLWFSVLYAIFIGLPFLAPVLMQIGAQGPGRIIYTLYSFVCHQLPERSFFLFGPKGMYPMSEIQYHWRDTLDPAILRQFIGDATLGWKVAWSDRMVAMYSSIWFFALAWWPLRKKIRPLPVWGYVLLALPMALDGSTHLISDLTGLNQGFRCTNSWLVALTGHALPGWFYYGDAFGSFNSWMRLVTGTLFGLGTVRFLFPIIDRASTMDQLLEQARKDLREKLIQGSQAGSPTASKPV